MSSQNKLTVVCTTHTHSSVSFIILPRTTSHGTCVTVIGFREYANFALTSEVIEFVDLEEIDGVFREPLPRMTLETLPDTGAWLPPFRSLRSLLEKR